MDIWQNILLLGASLNPVSVITAIIAGIIVAWLYRNIVIKREVVLLFIVFLAPFLISRYTVFLFLGPIANPPLLGSTLLLIYLLGVYFARKAIHKLRKE